MYDSSLAQDSLGLMVCSQQQDPSIVPKPCVSCYFSVPEFSGFSTHFFLIYIISDIPDTSLSQTLCQKYHLQSADL